jgi:hypothetical protein
MSSDPFEPGPGPNFGDEPRREPLPSPGVPFGGPSSVSRAAKEKVTLPAIFLIVVGALNLLAGLGLCGAGAAYTNVPAGVVEETLAQQQPKNWEELKKQGWTGQHFLNIYIYGGCGGGLVALAVSAITIAGGVRMLMLKSYGLAMTAAILTAIPCLSPLGCCLVGEGVGIWAIVVLLNDQVKAAFQRLPTDSEGFA